MDKLYFLIKVLKHSLSQNSASFHIYSYTVRKGIHNLDLKTPKLDLLAHHNSLHCKN